MTYNVFGGTLNLLYYYLVQIIALENVVKIHILVEVIGSYCNC